MVVVQIALPSFVKREVEWTILFKSIATRDWRGRNRIRRCNMTSVLSQYVREGKHTLGMSMADKDIHIRGSHLFQESALSGVVLSPRQRWQGISASKTTATRNTNPRLGYIWWWCSGDRLEGSSVPKETRFCMSRSSTLSSISGERKGRLRFCFAYMSVMWSVSSDMPLSWGMGYTSAEPSRPNELSGGDWLAMMGSWWPIGGIGEFNAPEWDGGPIGVCTYGGMLYCWPKFEAGMLSFWGPDV